MLAPLSVVDYALARRSTLADLFAGRVTPTDVCDAHPYLLRAARYHGEQSETNCPVCRKERLTHVTYVYGDELGPYNGRVKNSRDLVQMAAAHGEFTAYVVEVCQTCGWNHLTMSFVLGTGVAPPRRARRRAGE